MSAADVLLEVMGGIRRCVRLGNEEAVRKIGGKEQENVGEHGLIKSVRW